MGVKLVRMFENNALRIFGYTREEVTRGLKNYIMRSFTVCALH
jgi:hypothetical protein